MKTLPLPVLLIHNYVQCGIHKHFEDLLLDKYERFTQNLD